MKYEDPELSEVEYRGMDEFSIRKGRSYMSIFVDLASGRIVHGVEGKGVEAITPFLKVERRRARRLKAIAMDMNTGYVAAVREQLPKVDIVFDRYHVAALMTKLLPPLGGNSLLSKACDFGGSSPQAPAHALGHSGSNEDRIWNRKSRCL
jgi:transposase